MWVVAYGGDGSLRWVRQAKFGNLTSTAITVAADAVEGRGVGTGRGRAVYVAGEIIRVSYFIDEVLPPVEVEVPSEFGKMTEPLECSQSTPGEIGEFGVGGGLKGRPCSGVITARGGGSDIWLAKYDAVGSEPKPPIPRPHDCAPSHGTKDPTAPKLETQPEPNLNRKFHFSLNRT
jgi:hypothetical protein